MGISSDYSELIHDSQLLCWMKSSHQSLYRKELGFNSLGITRSYAQANRIRRPLHAPLPLLNIIWGKSYWKRVIFFPDGRPRTHSCHVLSGVLQKNPLLFTFKSSSFFPSKGGLSLQQRTSHFPTTSWVLAVLELYVWHQKYLRVDIFTNKVTVNWALGLGIHNIKTTMRRTNFRGFCMAL